MATRTPASASASAMPLPMPPLAAVMSPVLPSSPRFIGSAPPRRSPSFLREDTPDAAARITDIAVVARDQMHMDVHAVLPGGPTDVHADVVAVRRMICGDPALRAIEKRLNFSLFLDGHIEVARDVPARHHQDMATAQAVVVVSNVGERAFQQEVLGPTQLAMLGSHGFTPVSIV